MSRVIYTAGVFDLFHAGHLALLEASKAGAGIGGRLVVGVLTDDGAAAYKPRPIHHEHDRLALIRSLECVDAAFLQPGTDPSPVLRALVALGVRPAAMTHGSDWSELREGMATLQELGVEYVTIPLIERGGGRLSSTRIQGELVTRLGARAVGGL